LVNILGVTKSEAIVWGKFLQRLGVLDHVEAKFEFGDNQCWYKFSSKRDNLVNNFHAKEVFFFDLQNDKTRVRQIISNHLAIIKSWTIHEIDVALSTRGMTFALKVIQGFIRVGKELLYLNNLHSLQAIIAGLEDFSRKIKYKALWDKITLEDLAWFTSTRALFNSFTVLSKKIFHLRLPCIPCVGVYLDKIYLIQKHGKGKFTEVLINYKQMSTLGKIVEQFVRVQNVAPIFQTVPVIQQYLNTPHTFCI